MKTTIELGETNFQMEVLPSSLSEAVDFGMKFA